MRKTLFIIFLFISTLLQAQTTWYIDPDGNDGTGDGTIGNPWATLYKATSMIPDVQGDPGDIIHVNEGIYIEYQYSTLAPDISIVGEGNISIIKSHVQGTGTYDGLIRLIGGTNTSQHISYLKIDGDNLYGYKAISVYDRDNVSINNCTIIDFYYEGVRFGSGTQTGNSFNNNIVTNCGGCIPQWSSGGHRYNLYVGNNTGFVCHNNTITQTARANGSNGGCIGGYEGIAGAQFYNNNLTAQLQNGTNWTFAIEIWYVSGCQFYENTVVGEIDWGKDITKGSYDYGLYFHDNTVGWSTPQSSSGIGIQCEQTAENVIIRNNLFKNLNVPIYFCQYKYSDDWVKNIYIYCNLIYNVGMTGVGYGRAIRFESGSNEAGCSPPQYERNINIWHNTIVAYATSPAYYGIELPSEAITSGVHDIEIKDNIIVGFSQAGIYAHNQDNEYTTAIDTLVIQKNLLYGNGNSNNTLITDFTPTHYTYDTHIKSDPIFLYPPTDLHLDDGSPAINAGVAVTFPYGTTDYDGITWESPPSIGAFEFVGPGGTNIFYIDPAGHDDTGDGSSGNPWKTLYWACANVTTTGDTIHVNDGTYNETLRASLAIGVSIHGEGDISYIRTTFVATSQNDAAILLSSGGPTPANGNQSISYIKFDGTSYTATRAICVDYRNNVLIHHCTFTGFNYSGITYDSSNDVYPDPPTSTYATGNKVFNCTFTDCTNRANESGQIRIEGQDNMLVYNNTFTAMARAAGLNGNCITTNWNTRLKFYDNDFYKNADEGSGSTSWNFFFEAWHFQGEDEICHNTFNGGAVVDIVNVEKGIYQWGLKVHDNEFLITSQIAKGLRTSVALDFEERGGYESVYIYNNHFKNYPNGIMLLATMQEEDVHIDDIYIYCNIFENMGYTDFDGCYAIFVNGEEEYYDYYADNIRICQNTILAGSSTSNYGIRWQVPGATTNITIKDNIIRGFIYNPIDFAYQLEAGYVDIISVENNLYYSNGTNAADFTGVTVTNKTEQNNLIGDPLFESSTDFHLTVGSPAIGTGIAVGLTTTDYEGELWDDPPSIGAYTFWGEEEPPVGGVIIMWYGKILMWNGKITHW